MGKPPKTMQPEHPSIDVNRSHRSIRRKGGNQSKNGDKTFHHYMARKIDLQRQQFSAIELPPPPEEKPNSKLKKPKRDAGNFSVRSGKVKLKYVSLSSGTLSFETGNKKETMNVGDSRSSRKNRTKRPPYDQDLRSCPVSEGDDIGEQSSNQDSGMFSLLERLKKRHGDSSALLKNCKRNQSTGCSSENISDFPPAEKCIFPSDHAPANEGFMTKNLQEPVSFHRKVQPPSISPVNRRRKQRRSLDTQSNAERRGKDHKRSASFAGSPDGEDGQYSYEKVDQGSQQSHSSGKFVTNTTRRREDSRSSEGTASYFVDGVSSLIGRLKKRHGDPSLLLRKCKRYRSCRYSMETPIDFPICSDETDDIFAEISEQGAPTNARQKLTGSPKPQAILANTNERNLASNRDKPSDNREGALGSAYSKYFKKSSAFPPSQPSSSTLSQRNVMSQELMQSTQASNHQSDRPIRPGTSGVGLVVEDRPDSALAPFENGEINDGHSTKHSRPEFSESQEHSTREQLANSQLISPPRTLRFALPDLSRCLPPSRSQSQKRNEESHVENEDNGSYSDEAETDDPEVGKQFLRKERPPNRPDLFFFGIVVKVTGYTDPDDEAIKRLVQRHGGDFEIYETHRVTHMISEHLSKPKADRYRRQRDPRPVCVPAWITDCVREQRLLPHTNYLVPEIRDAQRGLLATMFKKQAAGLRQAAAEENERKNSIEEAGPLENGAPSEAELPHLDVKRSSRLGGQLQVNSPQEDHPRDCDKISQSQNSSALSTWSKGSCAANLASDFSAVASVPSQNDDSRKVDRVVRTMEVEEDNPSGLRDDGDSMISQGDRTYQTLEGPEPPKSRSREKFHGGSLGDEKMGDEPLQYKSGLARQGSQSDGDKIKLPNMQSLQERVEPGNDRDRANKIRTTGTDPDFLDRYFSASRLSFIGSFKQRTGKSTRNAESHRTTNMGSRIVAHVDLDCFFAAVVLRNYPQYRDKPVVISHHGNRDGHQDQSISFASTSECATCNYIARNYGIKKGMFLGQARKLCRDVIVLPYDFEGYEEVSEQVLDILHKFAASLNGCVEPVSCDEAYMEVFLDVNAREDLSAVAKNHAEVIRRDIFEATQCTASIGIASNKLLAKLATDKAKPNGSFVASDYKELLRDLRLRDLPGIGYRLEPKLKKEGLLSIQDVWFLGDCAEHELSQILGPKLGHKIHAYCNGIDDRPVKPGERKTIGAECNYGVRFDGLYGIDYFIAGLAKEVEKRMISVGVKGKRLTLKIKRRKPGAKEPPKFLGHGACFNLSKSTDIDTVNPSAGITNDAGQIAAAATKLLTLLNVPVGDIRGAGIVVSKLQNEEGAVGSLSPSRSKISKWFGRKESNAEETTVAPSYSPKSFRESDSPSQTLTMWQIERSPSIRSESSSLQAHPIDASQEKPTEIQEDDIASPASLRAPPKDDPPCAAGPEPPPACSSPIALPPLSQIHMSQVDALPEFLRKEIVEQVKIAESSKRVTALTSSKKRSTPSERFAFRGRTLSKTPESSANSQPTKTRLRQTSLKRMMKLAAVKAGEESTDIALSQFDRLPLKIKLQIANQDENPLGTLSQSPYQKRRGPRQTSGAGSLGIPTLHDETRSNKRRKIGTVGTRDTQKDKRNDKELEKSREKESGDESEEECIPYDPDAFHNNHILPLSAWLDEHSPHDHESMDKIKHRFRSCLADKRFYDMIRIFRFLRSRKDEWGSSRTLRQLAEVIVGSSQELAGVEFSIEYLLTK